MLGHEQTEIKEIYDVANIKDIIKNQKEIHKQINSPISELGPKTSRQFRILAKGEVPATKEVHTARKRE